MELTNKFKMANYLMRNKDVFQKLVAAIQDHKNMPLDSRLRETLRMMLKRQRSDAYVKYPETLINIMYSYFGREVAWTLIVDTLRNTIVTSESLTSKRTALKGWLSLISIVLRTYVQYWKTHWPTSATLM